MEHAPPIVLSLGGSLVAPPTGINTDFLTAFRHLILEELKVGKRFILIVGGGATARVYMHGAKEVAPLETEDMDWLGIHATRINAHLLRTIFREHAHPVVCKNPSRKMKWSKSMLIAAGWKPGWSTTKSLFVWRISTVPPKTLTNVERVYDKDPAKHIDVGPVRPHFLA
jgi:uridylate kinase